MRYVKGRFKIGREQAERLVKFDRKVQRERRGEEQRERYSMARKAGLTTEEARKVRGYGNKRAEKYVALRKKGSMVEEAIRLSMAPEDFVAGVKRRMLTCAKILAAKHGVLLKHIQRGMSFSYRTVDDWEIYVGLKKKYRG